MGSNDSRRKAKAMRMAWQARSDAAVTEAHTQIASLRTSQLMAAEGGERPAM